MACYGPTIKDEESDRTTFDDFSLDVVRGVVGGLDRQFYTREVWEHPMMRGRHRPTSDEEHTYRRMVGRYLSMHERELGLRLMPRRRPGYGHRWER